MSDSSDLSQNMTRAVELMRMTREAVNALRSAAREAQRPKRQSGYRAGGATYGGHSVSQYPASVYPATGQPPYAGDTNAGDWDTYSPGCQDHSSVMEAAASLRHCVSELESVQQWILSHLREMRGAARTLSSDRGKLVSGPAAAQYSRAERAVRKEASEIAPLCDEIGAVLREAHGALGMSMPAQSGPVAPSLDDEMYVTPSAGVDWPRNDHRLEDVTDETIALVDRERFGPADWRDDPSPPAPRLGAASSKRGGDIAHRVALGLGLDSLDDIVKYVVRPTDSPARVAEDMTSPGSRAGQRDLPSDRYGYPAGPQQGEQGI